MDRNLLLNYCYYLEDLDDNEKSKLFCSPRDERPIVKLIHTKDYYNAYEEQMIKHKIFDLKNIIHFCILDIVVLSISEKKLVHFTEPIYDLIKKMNFGLRKYAELILNGSYRFFVNSKDTNKNEAMKYFDIYNRAIDTKKIFPNDELILIENEIIKYGDLITNNNEIIETQLVTKIKSTLEKDLFTFTPDNIDKNEIIKTFGENLEKQGAYKQKISINSELLPGGGISSDTIYYPYSLSLQLNGLLDKYYVNLKMANEDKIAYKKCIINVIYYLRAIKEQFHSKMMQFLFYCLCEEK